MTRWFQHHTRKAWGSGRADLVVAAAEETLALWGHDGLDFEALAADIACEATLALELSEQIALLDRRIHDLYCEADPDGIVLSAPGVGNILAAQILGRLGDPHRFTSLAAARSYTGLVPKRNASGLTDHAGGPTKQGDACLRAALFMAADHARKTDPQLAARYQRLITDGRHHNSAICTIATVLLTCIVACLRNGTPYQLRDTAGRPITPAQGRAIIIEHHQISPEIRAARRALAGKGPHARRDERTTKGVAERSTVTPVPTPA
ncbi:MAG: transposase [Acidimicrobiia bacterium]|nr:transposase [Acidimicrobiia bacterium]